MTEEEKNKRQTVITEIKAIRSRYTRRQQIEMGITNRAVAQALFPGEEVSDPRASAWFRSINYPNVSLRVLEYLRTRI
jgi:hypothetical protein